MTRDQLRRRLTRAFSVVSKEHIDRPEIADVIQAATEAVDAYVAAERERILGRVVTRLESAWDDGNALGLDGWVGPNRGTEPDERAITERQRHVDLLVQQLLDRGES